MNAKFDKYTPTDDNKVNGFTILCCRETEEDKSYFFYEVWAGRKFIRAFDFYYKAKEWCAEQLIPSAQNWENSFVRGKLAEQTVEEMFAL